MCGRFSQASKIDVISKRIGVDAGLLVVPRYNIAPSQDVFVIKASREAAKLRWGLVPSWAQDPRMGNRMINARSETLNAKPSFKNLIASRRCLIPADGFYEWQRDEGGKRKRPMRITLSSEEPFCFAGLWDAWLDQEGKALESFTIITIEPNELVAKIHSRMPVILKPGDDEAWLDSRLDEASALALLKTYPASEMKDYEVDKRVNSPSNDDRECLKPADREEVPELWRHLQP